MKKLIQKLLNRETILYLVFGVLTTVLNTGRVDVQGGSSRRILSRFVFLSVLAGLAAMFTITRRILAVVSRCRARTLLANSVKRRPFPSKWGSNSVLP